MNTWMPKTPSSRYAAHLLWDQRDYYFAAALSSLRKQDRLLQLHILNSVHNRAEGCLNPNNHSLKKPKL